MLFLCVLQMVHFVCLMLDQSIVYHLGDQLIKQCNTVMILLCLFFHLSNFLYAAHLLPSMLTLVLNLFTNVSCLVIFLVSFVLLKWMYFFWYLVLCETHGCFKIVTKSRMCEKVLVVKCVFYVWFLLFPMRIVCSCLIRKTLIV